MRKLFTLDEARERGLTEKAIRCGVAAGRYASGGRGVYAEGGEPLSPVDHGRATAMASGGAAGGLLAGVLLGLDAVALTSEDEIEVDVPPGGSHKRPGTRRRLLDRSRLLIVEGVKCADGFQTLLMLAAVLSDEQWEQALESALRLGLLDLGELIAALPDLAASRLPGIGRIRRVLKLRPEGAPPTGSLLETCTVQLIRPSLVIPPFDRQVLVENIHGEFVAFVDLAEPDIGVFFELDGQQHKDQPVYDSRRETSVVAAKGWLCARGTWHEIMRLPRSTLRKFEEVVQQARRRPIALS